MGHTPDPNGPQQLSLKATAIGAATCEFCVKLKMPATLATWQAAHTLRPCIVEALAELSSGLDPQKGILCCPLCRCMHSKHANYAPFLKSTLFSAFGLHAFQVD